MQVKNDFKPLGKDAPMPALNAHVQAFTPNFKPTSKNFTPSFQTQAPNFMAMNAPMMG